MKNILITGKGSYIGTHFKEYMKQWPDQYQVDELDMMDPAWEDHDFSKYDVVYHVAGLAHSTPDESQRDLYYQVNTELAFETAKLAKRSGVRQFIFMSSIIVYGSGKVGEDRVITKSTPLTPDNFYGDSKKQAEIKLQSLKEDGFKVVILRPPMIYGPKSKGNYPMLSKLARKTPIFPDMKNQRSMLYIGNLVEFVRLMIENEEDGVFLPQNDEYTCTSEMVKEIASVYHHKILFTRLFNPIIRLMKKETHINKMFGNLTISKELSSYSQPYCLYTLKESLIQTEEVH